MARTTKRARLWKVGDIFRNVEFRHEESGLVSYWLVTKSQRRRWTSPWAVRLPGGHGLSAPYVGVGQESSWTAGYPMLRMSQREYVAAIVKQRKKMPRGVLG